MHPMPLATRVGATHVPEGPRPAPAPAPSLAPKLPPTDSLVLHARHGLSGEETLKATYNLTFMIQQFAIVGRALARGLMKTTMFLANMGAKHARTAGRANQFLGFVETASASKFGRALGFLNKWIPVLNAIWIVASAWQAVSVFRAKESSNASKMLSLASLALAGTAVWAGVAVGGPMFWSLAALSVVSDFALAECRERDRHRQNTNKIATRWVEHPAEGLRAAGRWVKKTWSYYYGKTVGNVRQFLGMEAKVPVRPSEVPFVPPTRLPKVELPKDDEFDELKRRPLTKK